MAWEEAFLEAVDAGAAEVLWFWEAPEPFVVVGYGQAVAQEVNLPACAARGIPILRRCSGGGAVVQGPGCLNYGLALRLEESGPCNTVTGTNRWVMERQLRALNGLLADRVEIQGYTDLALRGLDGVARKFSGNAQRRKRSAVLFHGTILTQFDLGLITELLPFPSAQPEYRASRSHLDFVVNTGLSAAAVRAAIRNEWSAYQRLEELPSTLAELAFAERYSRPEWHQRR
jgi:lipoate-protein ligase A